MSHQGATVAVSTASYTNMRSTARLYYKLTKPGVLFGNVITGVAGFLLASSALRMFHVGVFVAAIGGMTLIIASACVLNNVLDQDIDRIMARTKQRGIASGAVRPRNATIFSVVLGVLGVATLAFWTNWLVVTIGVLGFVTYVWLYGALSKRRSIHGTLVGSISGAAPILAGYVAASGRIDAAAILVFLALFFWQFPEFYAIAVYRMNEYKAAHVPVITVVKGVAYTKWRIAAYTVCFVLSSLLLTSFGYTGFVYAVCMAIIGAYWLLIVVRGFRSAEEGFNNVWARQVFRMSLNVILLYSLLISIGPLLP